jgi:hypothetical protein
MSSGKRGGKTQDGFEFFATRQAIKVTDPTS